MHRAFSLVELSIFLVILGLLTGGILAGRSLLRASELRAGVGEQQRYFAAVYAFRDKYSMLPGDMNNAVRFWGAQAGGTTDGRDATCATLTTGATGTETCNGDGNGRVAGKAAADNYERYRFWQHLANAGLVEGSYSGVSGAGTTTTDIPGENTPGSRLGSKIAWHASTSVAGNNKQFPVMDNR